MDKQIYTPKELAKALPIGEHKLREMANRYPSFPHLRVGNRLLFFKDEVEDWLRKQSKGGVKL